MTLWTKYWFASSFGHAESVSSLTPHRLGRRLQQKDDGNFVNMIIASSFEILYLHEEIFQGKCVRMQDALGWSSTLFIYVIDMHSCFQVGAAYYLQHIIVYQLHVVQYLRIYANAWHFIHTGQIYNTVPDLFRLINARIAPLRYWFVQQTFKDFQVERVLIKYSSKRNSKNSMGANHIPEV